MVNFFIPDGGDTIGTFFWHVANDMLNFQMIWKILIIVGLIKVGSYFTFLHCDLHI